MRFRIRASFPSRSSATMVTGPKRSISALTMIQDCGEGTVRTTILVIAGSEPPRLDDPLQKRPRALLVGAAEDPVRRPLLMNDAVIEEAHFRCHLAGKTHLVSGEQHGHALGRKIAHDVEYFRDEFGV